MENATPVDILFPESGNPDTELIMFFILLPFYKLYIIEKKLQISKQNIIIYV